MGAGSITSNVKSDKKLVVVKTPEENIETGIESEGEKTDSTADDSNNDVSVDMTDLEPFLGFMSETAYEELKTQLVQICQERNCSSVRKLTYQQTQAFDVASFILLPDGSVYQCNYNLKSCQVSVSKTDYTEVQINQMKEKQLQEEQQKLEQEQKAEKQKLQKKKVEKKMSVWAKIGAFIMENADALEAYACTLDGRTYVPDHK